MKPDFHFRFDLEIPSDQIQQRFTNRILTDLDHNFSWLDKPGQRNNHYHNIMSRMAWILGIRYNPNTPLSDYFGNDFFKFLRVLEALRTAFVGKMQDAYVNSLDDSIVGAITTSELDLGIEWKSGIFKKTGAKLLDENLINEPMQWLSNPKYENILNPFKKGLSHYLESHSNPERLLDTITDVYEALEAMVKEVTGNDRDLSANRELFISKLKLSEHYKRMLENHIEYANQYRHATKPGETRKLPVPNEVEAFVYTTGLFIRLAIQKLNQ